MKAPTLRPKCIESLQTFHQIQIPSYLMPSGTPTPEHKFQGVVRELLVSGAFQKAPINMNPYASTLSFEPEQQNHKQAQKCQRSKPQATSLPKPVQKPCGAVSEALV